jgi:hypothetical protein
LAGWLTWSDAPASNDPMEEDDGTNQMIQDLFSHPNEDGDSDGIYDEPLLEKENK